MADETAVRIADAQMRIFMVLTPFSCATRVSGLVHERMTGRTNYTAALYPRASLHRGVHSLLCWFRVDYTRFRRPEACTDHHVPPRWPPCWRRGRCDEFGRKQKFRSASGE